MPPLEPGLLPHEDLDTLDAPTPRDLRLILPALTCWLTAFVLLPLPSGAGFPLAGALAAAAATCLFLRSALAPRPGRAVAPTPAETSLRPLLGLAGVLLALASVTALATSLRVHAVESSPLRAAATKSAVVTLEAVAAGRPEPKRRGTLLLKATAQHVAWPGHAYRLHTPVLLIGRTSAPPPRPDAPGARQGGQADRSGWGEVGAGVRIRVVGRAVVPGAGELLGGVVVVRGTPEVVGEEGWWGRVVRGVRGDFWTVVRGLEPERRGVLVGMVVGDKSGLEPGVEEEFRASGLLHCMVVSGANLAILTVAVLFGCRWLGVGNRWGAIVAGVVMAGFVGVVGAEPSVLRAAVMGTIGLLAVLLGRERQGLAALAAAVVLLVWADPGLARSYGFVLSVVASGGLLVIAPRVRAALERRGASRRVAECLAVPIAAQVAVAPVLVLLSGEVNLVAIPANVLAEPAIVVATVLGCGAAFLSPVAPGPASYLADAAGFAVGWVISVARTASSVPHGSIPWRQSLAGSAALITICVAGAFALRHSGLRRITAAIAAGTLIAAALIYRLQPGWPPPGWRFVACDVGQGDALVLWAAPHQAVVVDAGPDPVAVDRCLRSLSIHAVPLLVLSHPHADHIAGVPGVARRRTVGTVAVSPFSARTAESRSLTAARLKAIPQAAARGDRWRIGALDLEVIGPLGGTEVREGDSGDAVNDISLVLVARWPGLSALLPGDIEETTQEALRDHVPHVDVLKVPHHGSARQDPAFLTAPHPRLAVISVGADNDYGHPSTRALTLLHPTRTLRTDRSGDIAITAPTLTITTHRP
ncbi:ComEC/Rec2 family competence protein [Actinocorallia longicatena]|uniref:ComEC/Rec2 family competence protein n=1 Tax=Actinocorallia longicatena TaxID=111803 RepID=A0ABP6QLC5_9ACTN